jgi:hypothetical protein
MWAAARHPQAPGRPAAKIVRFPLPIKWHNLSSNVFEAMLTYEGFLAP